MTQQLKTNKSSELSDGDLLIAVAEKDRGAFDVLFQRHQCAFFNLAFRITGSREIAEDATQDAACRIWRSASAYRPDGNARAWMLRIVVRSSLRRPERRRKEMSIMDCQPLSDVRHNAPTSVVEQDELLVGLEKAVGKLALADRRIVALYWGAEMTQREVGKALGLAQRTVSYRITQILEELRSSLANAGYSATLPILLEGNLRQVILEQQKVPPGLFQRVQESLNSTMAHSVRVGVAKFGNKFVLGGVAVLLALGSLGLFSNSRHRQVEPPNSADPRSEKPVVPDNKAFVQPVNPIIAKPSKFHRVWTFENGKPEGMDVGYGRWDTGEAYDGRHFLITNYNELTLIKLPMLVEDRYYRVRCKVWLNPETIKARAIAYHTFYPTRDRKLAEFDRWERHGMTSTAETDVEYWVLGRVLVNRMNGELRSLVVFNREVAYTEFFLRVRNWWVREIAVDSVEPAEVPTEMKDLETLKKKIGGEVMRSEGTVDLFEFRDPPKP